MRRGAVLLMALALSAAACSGGGADDTVPESTTFVSISIITTTTEPTFPNDVPFLVLEDRGPYVYAIQHYLNCGGHADLTIDGVFGPASIEAVKGAQATARRERTGEPDEDTFAALARGCDEVRAVEFDDGESIAVVGGSVAPEDPEKFTVALVAGWEVTFRLEALGAEVVVVGADGSHLQEADGSQEVTVRVPKTQEYEVTVLSGESVSYFLEVDVPVRTISDESPIEVETVDAMLDIMFEAVAVGDLFTAMSVVGSDVTYRPLGEFAVEGAAGRGALLASLSRLAAEGFSWESLGVDDTYGEDGDVVTFAVSDGTGDPDIVAFAGRLENGVFSEWWDQPPDVETTLAAVYERSVADDTDGLLTLFEHEVTFHSNDGTLVTGTEGTATVIAALGVKPRVFLEMISYETAVARFRVSTIAADPDTLTNQARFDFRIAEWWENP
ncbi:peptidoglycan-binding protein [bacterium]|nr:peptidoglycan-binding protein [bacterium]